MKPRTAVILVFATFGLLLFPLTILANAHLYADGAYFLAKILETHAVFRGGHTLARAVTHYATQAVPVAAVGAGASARWTSLLYGAALYYVPWACWAAACWRLVRARMHYHALILSMMYAMLMLATGWFAVLESHLAVAVFVLTLSILVTSDLRSLTDRLVLLVLGVLAFSLYEFWVVFYPACLAVLAIRVVKRPGSSRVFASILAVTYAVGIAVNVYAVMHSAASSTRDTMFLGENMAVAWPVSVRTSILFLLILAGAVTAVLFDEPSHHDSWQARPQVTTLVGAMDGWPFLAAVGVVAFVGLAIVVGIHVPAPAEAFSLRILNLILPMLFAVFLGVMTWLGDDRDLTRAPRLVFVYGLVALLVVTGSAWLIRAYGYSRYEGRVVAAAQASHGYVAVGKVLPNETEYGWGWTYPTDSLVFQAIRGVPITALLYNPDASWQPYDSKDKDSVARFVSGARASAETSAFGDE